VLGLAFCEEKEGRCRKLLLSQTSGCAVKRTHSRRCLPSCLQVAAGCGRIVLADGIAALLAIETAVRNVCIRCADNCNVEFGSIGEMLWLSMVSDGCGRTQVGGSFPLFVYGRPLHGATTPNPPPPSSFHCATHGKALRLQARPCFQYAACITDTIRNAVSSHEFMFVVFRSFDDGHYALTPNLDWRHMRADPPFVMDIATP
jgi:hypothetical protein